MPMPHPSRAAFTLIEMLIALAAGSGIVMVAVSGFRAASASMVTARHMAIENELVNQGVLSAFDEVDFWQGFISDADLPRFANTIDATNTAGKIRLGTPFTPFGDGRGPWVEWPKTNPYVGGWVEKEEYWAITADNERAWWSGNPMESWYSTCDFGRYAILGASRQRQSGGQPGTFLVDSSVQVDSQSYGTITIPKPDQWGWLFDRSRMLGDALGWYGMIDYLPKNHFWPIIQEYSRASDNNKTTAVGYLSVLFTSPSRFSPNQRVWPYFVLMQHIQPNLAGLDFLTDLQTYTVVPMSNNALTIRRGVNLNSEKMIKHNRCQVTTNLQNVNNGTEGFRDFNDTSDRFESDSDAMARYILRSSVLLTLLPIRPQEWPAVEVQVGRFISVCRFQTQAKVSWTNAQNGEKAELRFSSMGTTLRGARRQRGLDR